MTAQKTGYYSRKRRKRSPLIPILLVVLLALLLVVLLLHSCESKEGNVPVTEPASTETPTEAPTEAPTEIPTEAPTEAPTEEPTEEPTEAPTEEPTEAPTEAPAEPPGVAEIAVGQKLADLALAQVGKAYSFGGTGPDEYDTSGLVLYCCQEATGISLPHSVTQQAEMGIRVEKEDLLPGDVVFFWTEDPEAVEYTGIYIGDGQFVAARNPEKPVSQMNMNMEYFAERYLFACRYW